MFYFFSTQLRKVCLIALCTLTSQCYDVTLVTSSLSFANGIERVPIMVADLLGDTISINILPDTLIEPRDLPPKVKQLTALHAKQVAGDIALFFDPLWYPGRDLYQRVPLQSPIKIAYTMLESTAIPYQWTRILNNFFDAAVVPDPWLLDVYRNSGVRIPLFVLPIGLYLEDFLKVALKTKPRKPFTFGVSAAAVPGKNQQTLIDTFLQEFGDSCLVRLRIHSRAGNLLEELRAYVESLNVKNVEFIGKPLSQAEYVTFMASLDCYVLLSEGEGFSITPREALVCGGTPCILSDNTAHTTICKTGFVKAIPSTRREKAYYHVFDDFVGYKFHCNIKDVRKALRDVYQNYPSYFKKALQGREWVKQRYEYNGRKQEYLTLVNPLKVRLGNSNSLNGGCLTTTSQLLYSKYLGILSKRSYLKRKKA